MSPPRTSQAFGLVPALSFAGTSNSISRLFVVTPPSRSIGNLSLTARRDDAVAQLTFEFMRVCVVFVFRTASPRYRQLVCVSTKICPAKQSANSEEALRCVFQCGS